MTRLDAILPEYEARMVEERIVHAPRTRVFEIFENLKISDMRLAKFLAVLRNFGRPIDPSEQQSSLGEQAQQFGWVTLLRDPGREIVVGLVGQVWRKDFGVAKLADRDAFLKFKQPGYAKIIVSYRFDGIPEGTRMISETRVHCTDPQALRRFRWYWRVIQLGARLSVRSGLSATKRRAEAA